MSNAAKVPRMTNPVTIALLATPAAVLVVEASLRCLFEESAVTLDLFFAIFAGMAPYLFFSLISKSGMVCTK